MTDEKKFLEQLFGNKPENTYIQIFHLPTKRSHWFADVDSAAKFVESLKDSQSHIYFGCGLTKEDLGPGRRGKKADISAVPGLWVDIDIAHDVHKKSNLPKSTAEACELVEGLGIDPSLIVHSGHGIHVYWLFKEPLEFENNKEREDYEKMARRLQGTILARAAKKGLTIDATWDITRILRVPGTINWKDIDDPIEVKQFKESDVRLAHFEEFDELLIPESELGKAPGEIDFEEHEKNKGKIEIDFNAEPPVEKHDSLCAIDSKFMASWSHQREDLADQSPSGYVMSLTILAVKAGWSDQEIANLVIAWYRRHGQDMNKAMRRDYLIRTILKARAMVDKEDIINYVETVDAAVGTDYEKENVNAKQAMKFVSKALKLNVISLTKYQEEDDATYQLVLDVGKIKFKSTAQLIESGRFKNRLYSAAGISIEKPKNTIWEKIIRAFTLFQRVIRHDESTMEERMANWIDGYLDGKKQKNWEIGCEQEEPFVFNGHWYLFKSSLKDWVFHNHGVSANDQKFGTDLLAIGAQQERFSPLNKNTNRRSTKRPWKIPKTVAAPLTSAPSSAEVIHFEKKAKEDTSQGGAEPSTVGPYPTNRGLESHPRN